jgi:hypothetical protein
MKKRQIMVVMEVAGGYEYLLVKHPKKQLNSIDSQLAQKLNIDKANQRLIVVMESIKRIPKYFWNLLPTDVRTVATNLGRGANGIPIEAAILGREAGTG